MGIPNKSKGIKRSQCSGKNHYRYISDRSIYLKNREHDPEKLKLEYRNWRLEVYKRDNYKCRINNCDCAGRIIAHYILGFTKFPELRYNINNGITLCLFHHPLKRIEEQRLIPFFQQMVEVKG